MSKDHNTKSAKLVIDICAMFAVTKAIFSNFAIARAGFSNGFVRAHVKNKSTCARDGEVTKNSLRRREHLTDINNKVISLSIMIS